MGKGYPLPEKDFHGGIFTWRYFKIFWYFEIPQRFIFEDNNKEVSKFVSCHMGRYIIQVWIWLNLKTPFTHNASGIGYFIQSLSSFLIILVVTCTLMPSL